MMDRFKILLSISTCAATPWQAMAAPVLATSLGLGVGTNA
jgi:hypothetical protein